MLFWGASFLSIKVAVQVFPAMTLGMFRFALAVIMLLFIKAVLEKKSGVREKLRVKDLPSLIGASITGVSLYFFFENNGVARVTVSEASLIVGAIPVFSMLAERIFLHRKMRPQEIGGAFISIAGIALICGISLSLSGSVSGYLFMSAAVICWTSYNFITMALTSKRSQIYIVFWQSLFGFLGFAPFAIAEMPHWGNPTLPVIVHIIFLGTCCSALGYLFYAKSLEVLGVGISSIFINFIPVVTVIAGFLFMGDRLTLLQWAGAAFVVSGITLAIWRKREPA
ncbi:membrane protein [Spirochaetia bacterium]|nr:membrane protein [Spirochaetia bacterium]